MSTGPWTDGIRAIAKGAEALQKNCRSPLAYTDVGKEREHMSMDGRYKSNAGAIAEDAEALRAMLLIASYAYHEKIRPQAGSYTAMGALIAGWH